MVFNVLKKSFKFFLIFALLNVFNISHSQTTANLEMLKPNSQKEIMFRPYLAVLHGGLDGLDTWKKDHTIQYYKELWYYCESFYVKRNYMLEGITLNEEIIDISRFESSRKDYDEAVVILPGFKDVLVLLPTYKLIYKPN